MLALFLALAGCGDSSLTACDVEPDLTGHWTLALTSVPKGIPRDDQIEADLRQLKRPNHRLGALVFGTLTSRDKGFFDTLVIPELTHNNGSKTGAVVGCEVKINVPASTMVTDDNADNGPLRLALTGSLVAPGQLMGGPSTVIRVDNPAMIAETFTWSGVQQ